MKIQTLLISALSLLLFLISCSSKKETEVIINKPQYSQIYENAKALFDSSKYDQVIGLAEQLIEKDSTKFNKESLAALVLKGQALKKLKRIPEAIQSFEKATEKASKLNLETQALGIAYHEYGAILYRTQPEEAKTNWEKALKIKRNTFNSNDLEISKTLSNLGLFHYNFDGNSLLVEKYYNESIEIKKQHTGQESPIGRLYNAIGVIRFSMQDFPKAIQYFKAGEKVIIEGLKTNPGNPKMTMQLIGFYNNLGAIEMETGNFEAAKEYFNFVLNESSNLQLEELICIANFNLGRVARKSGDPDLAFSYLDVAESKTKHLKANDFQNRYNIYLEYALTYLELLNNIPKTEEYTEKGFHFLASKDLENHAFTFNAHQDLGSIYLSLEKLDLAKKYFLKALQNPTEERINSITFSNLGMTEAKLNNYEKAEEYFNYAIDYEVKKTSDKNPTLARVKWRYAKFLMKIEREIDALKLLKEGISILSGSETMKISNLDISSIPEIPTLLSILETKAKLLNQMANSAKFDKEKHLRKALESFELFAEVSGQLSSEYSNDETKFNFNESLREKYEVGISAGFDLFELTKNSSDGERVFQLVEKYKASVLKENIRKSITQPEDSRLQNLVLKEQSLKTDLVFLNQKFQNTEEGDKVEDLKIQIANINIELNKIKLELKTDFQTYHDLVFDNQTLDIEKLKAKLQSENTTLVEFFEGDKNLYSFAISDGKLYLNKSSIGENYASNLDELLSVLKTKPNMVKGEFKSKEIAGFVHKSGAVFEQTLKPIWQKIPKNENLLIIPHGNLFYLPFEILIPDDFKYTTEDFSKLPYLFSNNSVRYEYSSGLAASNPIRKKSQSRYVGFAPDYPLGTPERKLPELELTEDEILITGDLLDGKTFIKKDASEEIFKLTATNANIIHFAGHALVNDTEPEFSELVFTNTDSPNEDDRLYAYELSEMNLSANLTVLSGCDTGNGKLRQGEGTMSLARAFKAAGSPNTVTSLWMSNDASTPALMDLFFKNLQKGEGKSSALNDAKKTFLERNANYKKITHPYYWSNFILTGDNEPVFDAGINFKLILSLGVGLVLLLFFFRRMLKK